MVATTDNLAFSPRPIEAVGLRAGEGAAVQIAMAIIQRTTALRAYNAFPTGHDWMEKLSSAYVVALATRSADTYLMRQIQSCIVEDPVIPCAKCREKTLGTNVIRARLFPKLASLRKHANALIHHLDDPENKGITGLNIQAVFRLLLSPLSRECRIAVGSQSRRLFSVREMQKVHHEGCKIIISVLQPNGKVPAKFVVQA